MNLENERTTRRGRRRLFASSSLAVAIGLVSTLTLSVAMPAVQDEQDESEVRERVDQTRTALERWHDTRKLIATTRRDWAISREILGDQIALVKRQTTSLEARIAEAKKSIGEADAKRTEREKEETALREAGSAFADTIGELEARMKALLPRLPAPIQERVKPLTQRIPKEPATTKESLSDRFANIVGILTAVNKFNREVHTSSEVRTLEGGKQVEVTALYVGVSQGYYVTTKGDAAGVGRPTADGWAWKPANESAGAITKAIKIAMGEEAAAFVPLPTRVQ